MLTRSIHAREWLFMQKAGEPVFFRDIPENLHHQHIMVSRNIGRLKHGGQFKLSRSHFIMPRARRNTECQHALFHFRHKIEYPRTHAAKVVVFHFLPLVGLGTKNRPSGQDKIITQVIVTAINQKVFLLGPNHGIDPIRSGITENAQDP